MKTFGDIKDEVMVQAGISTSVGFFTDTILNDYIQKAYKWATNKRKWPFTEGRVSTTYVSDQEEWVYPEGWRHDSIRLLQVGGKRFQKVNFTRYQEFREDESSDTEKYFSDFGGLYYINPKADVSGTITVWGQYTPVDLDVTDLTGTTIFSDRAEDGNEAIVEKVLSYVMTKEKKYNEAKAHEEHAIKVLSDMWEEIKDEQFGYHDTAGDGMFKRFDVLDGGHGQFKEDQWF